MANFITRLFLIFQALRELGPRQLGLYTLYKLSLYLGVFRIRPRMLGNKSPMDIQQLLSVPSLPELRKCLGSNGIAKLVASADEIVSGRVRLFNGPPVSLDLAQPMDIPYWTSYEISHIHPTDIKFIWEPARFGWVFTLGRAYYLTGDERYSQVFWLHLETFLDANPIYRGPNWVSAQEVALRLMAFVFAAQLFSHSIYTTSERKAHLAAAIANHADRIPSTLLYARAQNNNHLLSEAAGLITAALALPTHPHARRWLKLGQKWFNHGLESQISEDGAYVQHSTNYHRLMLQLALWVQRITNSAHWHKDEKSTSPNWQFSKTASRNLQLATHWLLALFDHESGRVPNIGPNDGAYIFPFTNCSFSDYRPVLQAASQTFLGRLAFRSGPWDEMASWLAVKDSSELFPMVSEQELQDTLSGCYSILRNPSGESWAYLRAAHFTSRPGHADQLHLDLWWRGLNVAQDAGSYLYNASPPWDNRLCSAFVHNTVTVDGRDQMMRVGKFLYLNWAQAEVLAHEISDDGTWECIRAQHTGYQHLGIIHQRQVTMHRSNCCLVVDRLLKAEERRSKQRSFGSYRQSATFTLHWLLPDWPYELLVTNYKLFLQSPLGQISVQISVEPPNLELSTCSLCLIRAGKLIHGVGPTNPTLGWVSSTYGQKDPALSLLFKVGTSLPIHLITEWQFPN